MALGGFDSTRFWHRFLRVLMIACLLVYLVRLPRLYLAGRRRGASVPAPAVRAQFACCPTGAT